MKGYYRNHYSKISFKLGSDMDFYFFLKCFFVGVLASSGCGPLFVLTFNRSAICGFFKGWATALGSSLGDSFYFFLGLLGALKIVSEFSGLMILLDLFGGLILIGLGVNAIKQMRQFVCVSVECSDSFVCSLGKAIFLTLVNPLIIMFFMAISMQILPVNHKLITSYEVFLSSLLVFAGSLFVLTSVSLFASYIGSCITTKKMRIIHLITGILFIFFAIYLFYDSAIRLYNLFF